MKSEFVRVALAMTVLGAVLLSLSCRNGGDENGNVSAPTTVSADPTEIDPCTMPDIKDRATEIDKAINKEIDNDKVLKRQRDDKKSFSIAVTQKPNTSIISITVTGNVAGEGKLKDFMNVLDKYLKHGCVQVAKFESKPVPTPTPTSANTMMTTSTVSTGFYWILCEAPDILCDNGECAADCNKMMPLNSNSNSNTNSNTNKGNTNKP